MILYLEILGLVIATALTFGLVACVVDFVKFKNWFDGMKDRLGLK